MPTAEHRRLDEPATGDVPPWRKWGCYLSERAWGTVREDYSADGDAWNYLTHDKARSKAYRWGEDGIAGLCDRYQTLIFSPAMWNGRDPILKERMFGLTSTEGNRGEDVKEYYFYLDATPTGSYMKLLYNYPQAEYPYSLLVDENRRRAGGGSEFELLDTGVFDQDRYFDVVVEYAKADSEDLCIKIEVFNRGRDDAEFHFVPQLWFRNIWGWGPTRGQEPVIRRGRTTPAWQEIIADDATREPLWNLMFDYRLGVRHLYAPSGGVALFTNNETNAEVVYGPGATSASPFTKDAFHREIVKRESAGQPRGYRHENVPALHRYDDGGFQKFRVRSLVGLVPLFAVEALDPTKIEHLDVFLTAVDWFVRNRPDLVGAACFHAERNGQKLDVLSIVDQQQLTRILQYLWNEDEFLSPGGIRCLSKYHGDHPFTFGAGTVRYEPGDAEVKIKGGNSNWRGPVWFPTSYLLIEALTKFGDAHGPTFTVDAPASSGRSIGTAAMSREIANRMIGLFTRGEDGTRRVYGGIAKFQQDPHSARLSAVPRVLPRRHRRRAWRESPDGMDGTRRESHRRMAAVTQLSALSSQLSALRPPDWPQLGIRRFQSRQPCLDACPGRLEPGRQDERFTQVRGFLVGGEPRSVGGQLEEHTARLFEVHRLEPEAIDDRRRARAG